MSDGIKIRVMNTQTITMDGWQRTGRRQYAHAEKKLGVRKNGQYWEVIGGALDGSCWQTMHWAMYQAGKV
jgi:hypothetical protein